MPTDLPTLQKRLAWAFAIATLVATLAALRFDPSSALLVLIFGSSIPANIRRDPGKLFFIFILTPLLILAAYSLWRHLWWPGITIIVWAVSIAVLKLTFSSIRSRREIAR